MDRKLHVDILILVPMLKIYMFWYSGWTDGQMDGDINPGGLPLLHFSRLHLINLKADIGCLNGSTKSNRTDCIAEKSLFA
jgi:hypothetical protein